MHNAYMLFGTLLFIHYLQHVGRKRKTKPKHEHFRQLKNSRQDMSMKKRTYGYLRGNTNSDDHAIMHTAANWTNFIKKKK